MRLRAGWTLIEALIAGILLALGMLPVIFMQTTSTRETAMDLRQLEAATLASELLEQVRAMAEGRIGVPAMGSLPRENRFPDFPEWVDVDDLVKGGPTSLLDATPLLKESTRLYVSGPRSGYRRFLQFYRAPLLQSDSYAASPHLLEVRVKVEYGAPGARPEEWRQFVLDSLISDEDISTLH